jgi:iron(III) transport system permease protein
MRPGSLAVLMLLLVNGIEAFEVPALLGIRANYLVFSTEVYLATRSMPRLDLGLAGAYAMVLVLLSVAAIAVYYRLLGTGEQFATVGAKGFRPRLVDLGAWRGLAVASALALLGIMFVLPLLTIAWAALLPYLQYPSPTSLAQVSLRNFQSLFAQAIVPRAFINSFLIGVGTAFLVCLVTSVTAYLTVKTRLPGRQLLDWLAFVPLAIPGTVVALSVLWTYLSLRVPVYGTLWIILAAYLTKYLPVAMRINSASMAQIHRDMEEAASTSGAGWATRLRVVLLPLMKPGLVAAWIWVMVHACREVSVGVMLYVPGTETIGVALFDLTADGGNYPRVAAFGVVIFGLLVVLSLLARAVGARRVTT